MHSGSHTIWHGVFEGWKHRDPPRIYNPSEDSVDGQSILIGHTYDKMMLSWKNWLGRFPVVMPMRHPTKVLTSHLVRGEHDMRWLMWYNQNWLNTMWIEEHYTPYYIHVDRPDLREKQLAIINDELDLELEHDWHIGPDMGCKYNTHGKIDDMHRQQTPQAYIQFYEETLMEYE